MDDMEAILALDGDSSNFSGLRNMCVGAQP